MTDSPSDRWPKTAGAAWEQLLDALQNESVCYWAGGQVGTELRPKAGAMNYGEVVHAAVEKLQEDGNLTIQQIMNVKWLCVWVARSARAT